MRLIVHVSCDNAAFEDNWAREVRKVLTDALSLCKDFKGLDEGSPYLKSLWDTNGDVVGNVAIEEGE